MSKTLGLEVGIVPVEYGELEHVEDHDESHAARLATCTNNHVKPLRGICAN
jgi:hypothetical protein